MIIRENNEGKNEMKTFENLPEVDFPHKKDLGNERFAYVIPLTFSRARINVSTLSNPFAVGDFY